MRNNTKWNRYHLTKKGWVSDYTYRNLMGTNPPRLLTRQYGNIEEIDFNYYKDTWYDMQEELLEIYLVLYPHPLDDKDYANYHKVNLLLNN